MVKKKPKTLDAEIIRITDDAAELDLTRLSTAELTRHIQALDAQLKRRQLELATLQVMETQELLLSRHRTLLVEKYLREIAALDRITPGGLKSVAPSEDDDPELVDEAWRIYVQMQRGGGSRFG
jgi:hypothetical protein